MLTLVLQEFVLFARDMADMIIRDLALPAHARRIKPIEEQKGVSYARSRVSQCCLLTICACVRSLLVDSRYASVDAAQLTVFLSRSFEWGMSSSRFALLRCYFKFALNRVDPVCERCSRSVWRRSGCAKGGVQ